MIKFDNGGILVESMSEVPDVKFEDLYLDIETASGDTKVKSTNPWKMDYCSTIGIALTGDDCNTAWFIPRKFIRIAWLEQVFRNSKRWINSNVKYDAHVLTNEFELEPYHGEYHDTVTTAKIIDSDRLAQGGYGLKELSRDWLHEDIGKYEWAMYPYLEGANNKDYGRVPLDLLAEYACQDVISNRKLHHYIQRMLPEECKTLYQTEVDVTKTLFVSERRGLLTDTTQLKLFSIADLVAMLEISQELSDKLGYTLDPMSNDDLYDLLCNRYDMPVLKRTKQTEKGGGNNPSFDKHVLEEYKGYIGAPTDIIDLCIDYRHHKILKGLFWDSWLDKAVDNVLHSDYNQSVRSGRMSCKNPNAQQTSPDAKKGIFPRPGYSFISMDYAQIEYRMIVHYIQDEAAIAAYAANPDVDFHQWVADMIGIERKPAKTLNFGMGYGMGKGKLIRSLSRDATLMTEGMSLLAMEAKAEDVFETYHGNIPNLRPTMRKACNAAMRRGFVFNAHKRRCHLPSKRAWVAFNRICQSDAADIVKEVAPTVSPAFDPWLAACDVHLVAIVHDEFLWECPTEMVAEVEPYLKRRLENPRVQYRVPIRTDSHVSSISWANCKPA